MFLIEDNNNGLGMAMGTLRAFEMTLKRPTHADLVADHKCGACNTVLSSPRAKKTCFGVHEEVCIKVSRIMMYYSSNLTDLQRQYHKTMFYLGKLYRSNRPLSKKSLVLIGMCIIGNSHKCDA